MRSDDNVRWKRCANTIKPRYKSPGCFGRLQGLCTYIHRANPAQERADYTGLPRLWRAYERSPR